MNSPHHSQRTGNANRSEENVLRETPMLNVSADEIAELIREKGWRDLAYEDQIKAVYDFCRNEMPFGYNRCGDNPIATQVLDDKLGQCNTKSTLLMTLLRALGIPCRLRGATVDRRTQKGAIGRLAYLFAPKEIIHTWVQVLFDDEWIDLEGVILDDDYLSGVQEMFSNVEGAFCGYATGTNDLHNPPVAWNGRGTYIQSTAIIRDLGVFDSPDAFYAEHGTNLRGVKSLVYKTVLQPLMNARVDKIRSRGLAVKGDAPGEAVRAA